MLLKIEDLKNIGWLERGSFVSVHKTKNTLHWESPANTEKYNCTVGYKDYDKSQLYFNEKMKQVSYGGEEIIINLNTVCNPVIKLKGKTLTIINKFCTYKITPKR